MEHICSIFDLITRRANEIFTSRGNGHGHDWEDWLQAESEVLQPVAFELGDSWDALLVVAPIDDYRPQDLKISVEPRRFRICGLSPAHDNTRPGKSEAEVQHFRRFLVSLNLPAKIDTSEILADIRHGVLEVRLPKALSQATA